MNDRPRRAFARRRLAPALAGSLVAFAAAGAGDREDRPGAVLKALDKFSGVVTTLDAPLDAARPYERLVITVRACRVSPEDESDAVAFLDIDDRSVAGDEQVFSGWMFAAEPSLSALDHPRYDVWVAACSTTSGDAS